MSDLVHDLEEWASQEEVGVTDAGHHILRQAAAEILRLQGVLAVRAVSDEEVANIIRQGINAYYDDANSTTGMAGSAIKALRVAGFTVIRTEARDGTD